MKKSQNNSTRASALQITLSVALISISAILFASSFRAAPPAAPEPDVAAITGPASQTVNPQERTNVSATLPQNGFFPPLPLTAPQGAPLITVSLPTDNFDNQVPISTIIIEPVNTTLIDPTTTGGLNYVGFQGDFTFDSAVIGFATPQVQGAGLTSTNWNVSSNILDSGPGTTKTLRISAFSLDFTPLNGMGTLFNLRVLRVSNIPGDTTPLIWAQPPQNLIL